MNDVGRSYPGRDIVCVYGGNRDKEVVPILQHILGVHADSEPDLELELEPVTEVPVTEVQVCRLVLTSSSHPNAVPTSELYRHCRTMVEAVGRGRGRGVQGVQARTEVVEADGPDGPDGSGGSVAGALALASRAAAQGGGLGGGASGATGATDGSAVVVVCGSLYVAAEARRAVARSEPGLFAKNDTVLL